MPVGTLVITAARDAFGPGIERGLLTKAMPEGYGFRELSVWSSGNDALAYPLRPNTYQNATC